MLGQGDLAGAVALVHAADLRHRLMQFKEEGKLLEAQRLEMRVNYDLEMLETMGFCSGIENYSRHLDGRAPGPAHGRCRASARSRCGRTGYR